MRVVLDTNILVSALLSPGQAPGLLLDAWLDNRFELLTSREQLDETARVTRYARLRARIRPSEGGRLVNLLSDLAIIVEPHVAVELSTDPFDNFLLGIALDGAADYLVTGDKADVLARNRVGRNRTGAARALCRVLNPR